MKIACNSKRKEYAYVAERVAESEEKWNEMRKATSIWKITACESETMK